MAGGDAEQEGDAGAEGDSGAVAPPGGPGSPGGVVACTLVELGEKGLLRPGGRWRAMRGAVRHGLAQARAIRSRQLAFLGWALFSAALCVWVLVILRRHVAAGVWAAETAVAGAWFLGTIATGYLHLALVRREDGTPWRSFLVPNGITMSRLALAPLVAFASVHAVVLRPDADLILWPLVYVVASDALDGQIARFFGLRSEWGRLADPFSDILLATWFAPGLWAGGFLASWVGFLIVFRYAGTLLAVFTLWGRGKPLEIVPTWPGRAANVGVDVLLPVLLGAAIRWPHWLGTAWLVWMERIVAGLVVINVVYLMWRLVRAWTARTR
ncbi:MAG: CDP-alcohol phosphatidyltransferase family protein [Deltaproteobacteria bacterium]|nr:CDP-alcohol phosphatidyltransferase family protein [Deltaproteobacteria bacterium]